MRVDARAGRELFLELGDLHRLECYASARLHRLGGKHAFCERYPGKVRAAVATPSLTVDERECSCVSGVAPREKSNPHKTTYRDHHGKEEYLHTPKHEMNPSRAAQSKHITFYLAPYCANFSAFEAK